MPNVKSIKAIRMKRRHRPPPPEDPPDYAIEMVCPMCGRRACDITEYSRENIVVGMKCPHCRSIIHLQCGEPKTE